MYQICGIFSVSSKSSDAQQNSVDISQGLLPTLMIVYVGLDLGVNTDKVTNSLAPKMNIQKRLIHLNRNEVDLESSESDENSDGTDIRQSKENRDNK